MTNYDEPPAQRARLESALEDRLRGHGARDLSHAILEQAGVSERPARARYWLVAALVVLGLSVIPAIDWLQERGRSAVDAGPGAGQGTGLVELEDPQDPVRRKAVKPANLAELRRLLQTAEGLRADVTHTHGVPMVVPGEAPRAKLHLYGPGARRDLGWCTTKAENDAKALRRLTAGFQRGGLGAESHAAFRRLHVDFLLAGNLELEATVRLPGNTIRGQVMDGMLYPSEGVWLRCGDLEIAVLANREQRLAWATVDALVSETLRVDRGAYRGEEFVTAALAERSFGDTGPSVPAVANAKRCSHLRLHDCTLEQLRALGGSETCTRLDLRFSPALHDAATIEELRAFPNLEEIWFGHHVANDAFGDGPLPSVRRVSVISDQGDHQTDSGPAARHLGMSCSKPVFRAFPNLVELVISGAPVDDDDLAALPPSLERLELGFRREDGGRRVTDRGIAALAQLPRLRVLYVGGLRNGLNPRESDPGLDSIRALAGASKLELLSLAGWFARDDSRYPDDPDERQAVLEQLAKLPALRHLSLVGSTDLRPQDVRVLRAKPGLEVRLESTGLLDEIYLGPSQVDTLARAIRQPVPVLTGRLRKFVPGQVVVRVLIDDRGRVESVRVLSSTNLVLESTAIEAVKKWRFQPARKDGKAVASTQKFPVRFAK